MTEGLGDAWLRATQEHVRLYAAWGAGGVGLNITGNVMVDPLVIERPGSVAIDIPPSQITAEQRGLLQQLNLPVPEVATPA